MAYPCLHSPKTTKETSSICRIQRRPIRRIEDIVCEDSGRYQAWSLLQEPLIHRIQPIGYAVNLDNSTNNVLIPLDSWTSGLLEYKLPISSNKDALCGCFNYDRINVSRMDDPNITIKEYIRLEEQKARKRAIAFNDGVSSKILSCEPTVSSLNDEINFRILFDDFDDEDYTVVFDKNSFSYKIISTNDLKMDSENDNEKVNLTSLPSPKPKISCFDDLDFFKDFENEFPAIVYNDAQTSKLDLLTELILNPQHVDEFDLNDETSVSEYNEKERNILYFNDLFLFNIIHPDDLKSEKDNDDNKIDIIQFRGNGSFVMNLNVNIVIWNYYGMLFYLIMNSYVPFGIPFDPKWYYKDGVYIRMLRRPSTIDAQGQEVFTSQAWRRLFDIRGPLVYELILEFFSTFRFGEAVIDLDTARALQFHLGGSRRRMRWREFILALGLHTAEEMQTIGISSAGDFLGTTPSYTVIRDPILRLCHRLFAAGRKSGAHISGEQFVARLAEHFRLLTVEILQGLTVMAPALPVIDMAELVRLQIYEEIDDTWAWVASGLKRQPDAAAGAPEAAPQPPPPPVAAMTMSQRLWRLEEEMQGLRRDVVSLRGLVERSITDQGRFSTLMISCMAQLIEASGQTYQAFNGTFHGSFTSALLPETH
ncbi:hypothetical protein Tco_1066803 [Tanacetum coccineum]|uniref:Uncharacterized protein n=1 Tax=Tanacetum coccineum TaxID=301880 RepID=A0ABQ5HB16_9ASTR